MKGYFIKLTHDNGSVIYVNSLAIDAITVRPHGSVAEKSRGTSITAIQIGSEITLVRETPEGIFALIEERL